MTTCNICQQNKSTTFTIDIPVDNNDEDEYLSYPACVCEKCWDIIATVALRRLRSHIHDIFGMEVRLRKLEVFTGMVAPTPLEGE